MNILVKPWRKRNLIELPHKKKTPTYGEIIGRILVDINGPIPVEELADQILRQRPSQARDPHQAALSKIHEEIGRQFV